MDFLKIWWVSHISHSKTQNSSIDTNPLSLIVLEIYHKNDFSTLTLNAVFTPQIWKRGKIKKHVFLIFRSSVTYPKIEMIGGGHLKHSPCQFHYYTRNISSIINLFPLINYLCLHRSCVRKYTWACVEEAQTRTRRMQFFMWSYSFSHNCVLPFNQRAGKWWKFQVRFFIHSQVVTSITRENY